MKEWKYFKFDNWQKKINIQNFIEVNYTEYLGNDFFLENISDSTKKLLKELSIFYKKQFKKNGVYDMDNNIPSTMLSHKAGYLMKKLEKIVGLQTDIPLKQAFIPFGGIKMANNALKTNGYKIDKKMTDIFTNIRKTHNQGVFDVYTDEMKNARKNKIITGLPDSYGRGRILGDYRRVALYGVDFLIKNKKIDLDNSKNYIMNENNIRFREEISEQIRALKTLKKMAFLYNIDISKPASNFEEAIQWLYFGYLGAIKTQNGAAMSIGRISAFLDIYIERDFKIRKITEKYVQEIIDHFIIKLRMIKFARTSEYNQLFSGFPIWATLSIGGMNNKKKSFITKTDFRFLNTLNTMGNSPEPNLTILYSKNLPINFKKFVSKISIKSSSLQFENDDLIRKEFKSNDCSISCCVSSNISGKSMQYFGARINLAKLVLYAINGGVDEITGIQVGPKIPKILDNILNFNKFIKNFKILSKWLIKLYINILNIIHYMHDKYFYESLQFSLLDSKIIRYFATGIAGFSHTVDSISAIKYGNVKIIRDNRKIAIKFIPTKKFPTYGNDNKKADKIAKWLIKYFIKNLSKEKTYRNSKVTLSLLTITSNVVYGKFTGCTPDGRSFGKPFSPGANPSYSYNKFLGEKNGLLSSLNSISKLDYSLLLDGISNTQTINPKILGLNLNERILNLINILDGYFKKGGFHLNVNILNKKILLEAQKNFKKFRNLVIRVSGYSVRFIDLNYEQQNDIILRTFHDKI